MNVHPVIIRELRSESRRSLNYWARVIGAGIALLLFLLFALGDRTASIQLGAKIFSGLNTGLFVLIWLLGPILTSDCISQERREGTLGLLFLTPLTSIGIVLGKCLIHILRAFSVLAALIPVLMLPLLTGGVSWKDAVMALSFDLAALLLAMGAGLLATTFARDWMRVLMLGELFAFFFACSMLLVNTISFEWLNSKYGPYAAFNVTGQTKPQIWPIISQTINSASRRYARLFAVTTNCDVVENWEAKWQDVWQRFSPKFQIRWLAWGGMTTIFGLLFLIAAVIFAAWRIRRIWREAAPSEMQQRLTQTFCEPRFWRSIFRGKMRRTLELNPIGWLQQYSVSSRLTKWGWCLFVVLTECFLIADASLQNLVPGQIILGTLLSLGLALAAASSFRQERETGALELLLVTPLQARQVIWGRVRGLWWQFIPSACLLSMVLVYIQVRLADLVGSGTRILVFSLLVNLLSTLVTLPFIGLCFSMLRLNIITAWILTCLTATLPPLLVVIPVVVMGSSLTPATFINYWCLGQVFMAIVAALMLYHRLQTRRFVLS